MDNDGMVAVVRGTRDSGIRVTLLDGNNQYTLLPTTVTQPISIKTNSQASQYAGVVDTSAQAIDGRYASVYQTVHCNMVPTSPVVDVSEFPPQRAALSKGHGNFEVGGMGSGETTFHPARVKESFRGGLSWPERGSVFSARPSVEPDAFANSLRKYPNLSPERSTEMVERLINYSQFKNSKAQKLQTLRAEISNRPRKTLEADIRTDESPTRERSRRYYEDSTTTDRYERPRRYDDVTDRNKKYDEGDRKCDRSFDRNYEVRNFRDVPKRGRELIRNPFTYPVCPTIREKCDRLPDETRDPLSVQISIDTQVEVPAMFSKEVATAPKINPSKRNVAISMSPLPSIFALPIDTTSKSIQTLITQEITLFPIKSVQSCFSSIDITNKKIKNRRKSKSQEELRENHIEDELLQMVKDLDPEERGLLRDDLLKTLKKIYKADKSNKVKIRLGRCVRDQLFSDFDLKDFTRELSNQLLSKIKKNNPANIYRAEVQSYRDINDENCVDNVIEEWLRDLPIKNRDYSGKSIIKDHCLLTIAKKIKSVVISKLKLDSDKSLKTEIIHLIEDIPIVVCGYDKRLLLNRLATDLIRRIKETITMCSHKVEKSNTNNKNNLDDAIVSKNSTTKEEEIKQYVREELTAFVGKFHLRICIESMGELEVELTDIAFDAMDAISSGKEDKIKEEILYILFDKLNITEYQANYFANNMILNMKKMLSDMPKVKSHTLIVLDKQRFNNTEGFIDEVNENDIKANSVWYTNQIIQQINKWTSCIRGLDPNDNFTKVVIHDLAGDIVDRHKYLELNPTTKVSKTDEIEHLKYQIFKWINKLVGDDNLETIEKAPELMERIRNVPVPMLVKPHNTDQGYCQMGCDYHSRPYSNSRRTSITVDYGTGIARSNITVAIGSVPHNKAISSDSEESRIEDTPSSQSHNKNKASVSSPVQSNKSKTRRMSDSTGNKQLGRSASKHRTPCCDLKQCNNTPADQNTQDHIIEEFDQFLKDWVQRIPVSEKPELTEKCRLGIYNGVWKAIAKIKMNPETSDNPLFYKDVLDDEIEELLDFLTQTPELKKQRNNLKAEVLEKAADINAHVAPTALNASYKQQLVENISNNLPKTVNRVDHAEQDVNKLYEEVMKLHLAEYFILYTKYKEDDPIKANVFKRKLLQEVHELVEDVKQAHGKELREIEVKQYVEGVIHALQRVPIPNEETINQETDEIILALEVEQWFSDLPLMPNEERLDMLSRRKYRDMLAKKLFDLENSNEVENEEQMKEEITKFLKRMPFIPGEAENMDFLVVELINRIKKRPKEVDADSKKAIAFVEPHGYEAFSKDMPLCSSYIDDQNGSSYMIVGGERAADTSMAYGGQYVQSRNDRNSQQEWLSLEQTAAPGAKRGSVQGAGSCCGQPLEGEKAADRSMPYGRQSLQGRNDPDSQQEWLSLEQTAAPGAMRGSLQGAMRGSLQGAGSCCGQPLGGEKAADRSMAYGRHSVQGRNDSDSQKEWLSLEQTAAPGAMRGSLQGAGSCCGRPSRSQSISSPRRNSSPAPQQGAGPCCGRPTCAQSTLSPRRSSSPSPQQGAGPCCGRPTCAQSTLSPRRNSSPAPLQSAEACCGRPTCAQNTSPPSRRISQLSPGALPSRQKLLSLDQSKVPLAMRRTSFASQENTDPCCKRATCPSQISTASQTYHSVPILDTTSESKTANLSRRLSASPNVTKGQAVSRGQSPGITDYKLGPATSKTKLKKSKPPTRQSSVSSLSDSKLGPATSKTKLKKSKPPTRQSSASSLSDSKLEPATSKTKLKKSKPPTRQSSTSSLSDSKSGPATSKTKPTKSKQPKGQSSASSLTDEKEKTVTSKTKLKKPKRSTKVDCECFKTPNNSRSPSVGTVSKGKSPVRDLSDDKLGQKAKTTKSKPPTRQSASSSSLSDSKSGPATSKTKPRKSKQPKGQSSDSSLLDEKSVKPKTKPEKINLTRGNSASSLLDEPPPTTKHKKLSSTKESPNTARRHSKLPEGTRPAASGPNYDSPEECFGRPTGYPTQDRTGPSDKSRPRKRSKDIEEERREADRRRMNTDDTDEDDLRCKCMERVWRWKRRGQCRPCDENPDLEYMYPFPMMYPPPPYFY